MAQARRRVLSLAVCACCHEAGFATAESEVIETLTVMLQSLLSEIGRSSQALCELSGRTETLAADVILALIEMGIDVKSLPAYGKRRNILRIPAPGRESVHSTPKILQTGQKRPLHPYVPDYFPPFPDPHSYIRTPTHRQPITEFEAIREKTASQKRDVERALTRFIAKTCESNFNHSLFANNVNMNKFFPLISIKPSPLPFIDALLPKDQIFEDD